MNTICTSCGLTFDTDGNLSVSTGDTTWPYDCDETNGAAIYCRDDGSLHTDPLPTSDVGSHEVAANVFGGAIDGTYLTHSFTIDNPSNCLPALAYVRVVHLVNVNFQQGVRLRIQAQGNQVLDFTNTGTGFQGAVWQIPIDVPVVTIPPGGSVNIVIPYVGTTTGGDAFLFQSTSSADWLVVAGDL